MASARILFIRDRLSYFFSDDNVVKDKYIRVNLRRGVLVSEVATWSTFSSVAPPVSPAEIVEAASMLPLQIRRGRIYRKVPFDERYYSICLRSVTVSGAYKRGVECLQPASVEDITSALVGVNAIRKVCEGTFVVELNDRRLVDQICEVFCNGDLVFSMTPVIPRFETVKRHVPPRVKVV